VRVGQVQVGHDEVKRATDKCGVRGGNRPNLLNLAAPLSEDTSDEQSVRRIIFDEKHTLK
jgi:hypothetical protein